MSEGRNKKNIKKAGAPIIVQLGKSSGKREFGEKPPWLPANGATISTLHQLDQVSGLGDDSDDVERNNKTLDVIIVGAPRLWHQSRKSLELLCATINDKDAEHLTSEFRVAGWGLDSEEESNHWAVEEGLMVGVTVMMMRHRSRKLMLCAPGGSASTLLTGPFNKKQIHAAIAAGLETCTALAGVEKLEGNWNEDEANAVKLLDGFSEL